MPVVELRVSVCDRMSPRTLQEKLISMVLF